MKKVFIWVLTIVVIVGIIDIIFGFAMRHVVVNLPPRGDYRNLDHILNNRGHEELYVLGSSVALNSINTPMLRDSLGMSAYNAGSNGQTFPYFLSMLEIIAGRPELKTVILGITPDNLTGTGTGNRYNLLSPFYNLGYDGIDRRLESMKKHNDILLKSSLYRYNTIWFRILLYQFYEPGVQGECGFIAKDIPAFFPIRIKSGTIEEPSDERKREFDEFVNICKNNDIRLIVTIPPRYEDSSEEANGVEEFLKKSAEANGFELWLDAYTTPLSTDSTLFYDNSHVNRVGADLYTLQVINRLRQ